MVVLVVLLMVAAMGGVVTSFAQSNAKSAERSADTSVGDAVAEAAMNHARSILWSAPNPLDPAAVPKGDVKLFGGAGSYHGELNGSIWTLIGVSTVTSGVQKITRTVSSQVAVEAGGDGPAFAVFTADSDCGGSSLALNPNAVEMDGALRSNGDLVITSQKVSIGHVSAYGPPCEVQIKSPTAELQKSYDIATESDGSLRLVNGAAVDARVHYWPAAFEQTDFVCTHRAKTFQFNKHGTIIPDGVYCAEESFIVAGNGIAGNITVIAPIIRIKGADHDLKPYSREVLFFSTGTEPMQLAGSSYAWEGIIFHPSGQVQIRGDEFSMLRGMIEAREVDVRGKAFRMVGTGPKADLGGDGLTLVDVPGSYRVG